MKLLVPFILKFQLQEDLERYWPILISSEVQPDLFSTELKKKTTTDS